MNLTADQITLLLPPRTRVYARQHQQQRAGSGRGRAGVPSLAVWFAEWLMAVSRAICTAAKAPVTFARGRAAIKETGGSVARIALQTHCQKRQRSSPATSHARSPATHTEEARISTRPSVSLNSLHLHICLIHCLQNGDARKRKGFCRSPFKCYAEHF